MLEQGDQGQVFIHLQGDADKWRQKIGVRTDAQVRIVETLDPLQPHGGAVGGVSKLALFREIDALEVNTFPVLLTFPGNVGVPVVCLVFDLELVVGHKRTVDKVVGQLFVIAQFEILCPQIGIFALG